MLITKTSATEKLRDATGLSIATAEAKIATLRTKLDGARHKVHMADVTRLIREENEPPAERPKITFSQKTIKRIREHGIGRVQRA